MTYDEVVILPRLIYFKFRGGLKSKAHQKGGLNGFLLSVANK